VGKISPRFRGDSDPPSFVAGSAIGAKPIGGGRTSIELKKLG